MAFSVPSESPAVVVREIDLTGVVRNVTTTTGAFVGEFRWGPVLERVDVADEAQLASTFGAPTDDFAVDYFSAASFLRYSSDLYVTRVVDSSAANAYVLSEGASAPTVNNEENFDEQAAALDSDNHTFIGRFPGTLGNSLSVSMLQAVDSADDPAFTNWTYASEFDGAPLTSSFADTRSASNDEVHLVVVDQDGDFTGTPGAILERYAYLSVASNAKTDDGSTNYIKDVVNNASDYIFMVGFDSDATAAGAGTEATSGDDFQIGTPAAVTSSLASGANGGQPTTGQVLIGYDLYNDTETVQIDFLIAPQSVSQVASTTVVNNLVTKAQSTRKDCVVVASPPRNAVVNNNSPAEDVVLAANAMTNSSYLILDNNFLKVYDKYNDRYVFIPAAPSTAGIMAASDINTAPWFSPAGTRRGQYLGITSLAWSPNKSQRDTLYKAGVNPIANIPGQGVLLYGDKTKLQRPSAFDRINVRRLFLTVERAIASAARQVLFEFNDEFTRAEFVNIVEPFLREIQGRRGITDFRVVCDETNNTPAVVDRNEFKADIFIKPARSINFVLLNFVGVRTGVDFEEVVGTV